MSSEMSAAIIGAIVGALLGGWVGYLSTVGAEKRKEKKLIRRLYSMLLLELSVHQAILSLEVDNFLQAWLRRGELSLLGGEYITNGHYADLSLRLNKLDDEYFSRFFPELLHAELIVELETYYRRVRGRNNQINSWNSGRAIDETDGYVQSTLTLFSSGMELIENIRKSCGISRYFVAAHQLQLDDFDSNHERHLYLLLLSQLKRGDLDRLRQAKEIADMNEDQKRKFCIDDPDISNIPKLIQKDPSNFWEQYL